MRGAIANEKIQHLVMEQLSQSIQLIITDVREFQQ